VSHSSKNGLSYCKDNDEHDKKKWRTGKSYFNTEEQMKEFKAPSTQLSTQELLLNVPPRPTTRRAMAARQSRIDEAGIRKVYSDTAIAPQTEQTTDTGHNSALFYELVEKNAEL
jgi:hypothetical protein